MRGNKRKTERGVTDFESVVKAIKAVKIGNKGLRATVKSCNIPKSSLSRYIMKLNDVVSDITAIDEDELMKIVKNLASYSPCAVKQVFSIDEEKALVEYIKICSNHYYGLSIREFCELAYEFAKKIKANYPSSWNDDKMAGKTWYYSFMSRNPFLTLRTPEQTSLNRIKAFCKENVDTFFKNFDSVLATQSFDANSIWNMDETGFSTVPNKIGRVIAMRGVRKVGQVTFQERGTMVTMALAVNAEGISIPPFFLFPRKNMQSFFMDNASPGAVGYANGSGWMQQTEFVKFMEHFIQRSKSSLQSPTLLLLDNHTSHLSIEALDMAEKHGVTLLSFPPHCSHKMQPLDVSVYGPVKAYYKSQCNIWQKNNAGKVIEIRHIPGFVKNALDLALSPANIKAGFQKTGISPYNPEIFIDSDFVKPVSAEDHSTIAEFGEQGNDEETQRRIVVESEKNITEPEKDVTTPTVSVQKSPTSPTKNLSSILSVIGPLQGATPTPKSNRGRKSMKSAVLNSPENLVELQEKQQKRNASETPKRSQKKSQKKSLKKSEPLMKRLKRESSLEEDEDFCIICLKEMPRRLTRANSIACNSCGREVHLKCTNTVYFICNNCKSE